MIPTAIHTLYKPLAKAVVLTPMMTRLENDSLVLYLREDLESLFFW